MAEFSQGDIDALFAGSGSGMTESTTVALRAFAAQARDVLGAGLESVTGSPMRVADVTVRPITYSEAEIEFAPIPHMGFEVRVALSPTESHLLGALVSLPDVGALLSIETGEAALADADFARAQTAAVGTSVRELLEFMGMTLLSGELQGVEISLSDLRIGQVEFTMGIVADVSQNAPAVRLDVVLALPGDATATVTLIVPTTLLDRLAATIGPDEVPAEPMPLRRVEPEAEFASSRGAATFGASGFGGHGPVDVHPVRFPPLPELRGPATSPRSLDLIMDVSMRVSVELGRTTMTVEEVLSLGPGSVVELNKLAGEAVDIMVNDQLIARGEVVVVDENFGVRVTEIVSPRRRANAMDGAA